MHWHNYGNFANPGNITTNTLTASQVSVSSIITFTGSITNGGNTVLTTTYNPVFCGGFATGSSGGQANNVGRVTSSCVRLSTGKYQITYLTAYPNNNYTPSAICYVSGTPSPCFACIGSTTRATKLEVNTFVSNVLTDCIFLF